MANRPRQLNRSLLVIVLALLFAPAQASGSEVWLLEFQGAVGPAKADLVIRSIDEAEAQDVAALVLRMDTPGGLDAAMRDIVKRILTANVPVVTFVAPNGSRAASAGTYIGYASHILAMAKATNIGASTPVTMGSPSPLPESPDDSEEAKTPLDTMSKKMVNDAVAYLQSLGELRGRNIQWAEQTVRDSSSIRASEALERGVIDFVAEDIDQLLRQMDGVQVELADGTEQLALQDVQVVLIETDLRHDILEVISDPTIAYALLIFGVYALILEFYSPGMIFPSIIGVVCLLLGAYGLQMLPVSYAGVGLVVVGLVFMAIEAFTPAFGILGASGAIAFVLGSFMLIDSQSPEFQIPPALILSLTAVSVALVLVGVGSALQARRQAVTTGMPSMVGSQGYVVDDFTVNGSHQVGKVWTHGELWNAQARADEAMATLRKGDPIRVTAVQDLEVQVVPDSAG